MKPILTIIFIASFCLTSNGQNKSEAVKLIKWSSESCDNSFNPYRLKNRISNIEHSDSTTIYTVHFSENCCVTFEPAVSFSKNRLVLLPYREYKGGNCNCNCCFSIRYEISGLIGKKYQLFFKDSAISFTQNYYDTVKTSYEFFNGEKINRSNKYGFKEGKWIKFYKDGSKEVVSEYPMQSLFDEPSFIWSKGYFKSGRLSFYERKDTTQTWFEDGELKSEFIVYKIGDTTFKKGLRKFENRLLQKEYLEKIYPTIFKSEFDTSYQINGNAVETVYKKEFFQNGKPKFLFGSDTSFSWFETGQIESKSYKNGKIQFDNNGILTKQSFSWLEKGPEDWRNLDNTLYVLFYSNGYIKEIELVRDESTHYGLAPGVRYTWAWSKEMNIIESPENWTEALPWTRFPELQLKSKMLIGLDKKTPSSH